MIFGSLISINSNSWLRIWIGLEINLLAFIPLIIEKNNLLNSESSLKYFIIQVFASRILLFLIIFYFLIFEWTLYKSLKNIFNLIFISTLIFKIGIAPFHFWFPNIIEGLNWINSLILITWQKLAPLSLLTYCLNQKFLNLIIFFSLIFGSLGGLNQTSLQKILAYSSINHIAWIISNILINENIWKIYFLNYLILIFSIILNFKIYNIFNINQIFSLKLKNNFKKIIFCFPLLSLGGLPPLLGFFPKWITLINLIITNNFILIICLINLTLITLFFYIRICYSLILINNSFTNWSINWNFKLNKNLLFLNNFFINISIYGIFFINLIFLLY